MYEGRDYRVLEPRDGGILVTVPDDGPVLSLRLDFPVHGDILPACLAAEILRVRAESDPVFRNAHVRARCHAEGVQLQVLARREDEHALREALVGFVATTPSDWERDEALQRLSRRFEEGRRDVRRIGRAAFDFALFGATARNVQPEAHVPIAEAELPGLERFFEQIMARRGDLSVRTGDPTPWRALFQRLPAPVNPKRPRRNLTDMPRRVVVSVDGLGVAYVAWAAPIGRVGPQRTARNELVRAILQRRLTGIERAVGAQGAIRIAWRHPGFDRMPKAALAVEGIVPPGRSNDFMDRVEAALASPPSDDEIERARAEVENAYRTVGTPRREVGPYVRRFVLAGQLRDPRAEIWAALPNVDAAAVRTAWRNVAEAPRVEVLVTPHQASALEAGSGIHTIPLDPRTLLPL